MARHMERRMDFHPEDREGVTQWALDVLGTMFAFGGQVGIGIHRREVAPGEYEDERIVAFYNSWAPGLNLESPSQNGEVEIDDDDTDEEIPEVEEAPTEEPAVVEE